ncbi:hypothetical protein HRbin39_00294 [bacterium HR39]|nr:hypothetical protein HRbin39_00294 [bacterium HR39]
MSWRRNSIAIVAASVYLLAASPRAMAALTPEQQAALQSALAAGTLRVEAERIVAELVPQDCRVSVGFDEILGVVVPAVEEAEAAAASALDAEAGAASLLRRRECAEDIRREELLAMACMVPSARTEDPYLRAVFESARNRALAEVSPNARDIAVTLGAAIEECPFPADFRERLAALASDTGYLAFVATLVQPVGGPPAVRAPAIVPPVSSDRPLASPS